MSEYQPGDVVRLTGLADSLDEGLSFGARGVIGFLSTEQDDESTFRELCWATPDEPAVVAGYVEELIRGGRATLSDPTWRDVYR